MTAQIANGGYSIKPKIIVNNNPLNFEEAKKIWKNKIYNLILNYLKIQKI
jgi:hypothetical protein